MGLFNKDYSMMIKERNNAVFLQNEQDFLNFNKYVVQVLTKLGYSPSDTRYSKGIQEISFTISKGNNGNMIAGQNRLTAADVSFHFTFKRSETFDSHRFLNDLIALLKADATFGRYDLYTLGG